MITGRPELLKALAAVGFDLSEIKRATTSRTPMPVLVRLHGRLVMQIPPRLSLERMGEMYGRAERLLRESGLPATPVVDRHEHLARPGHEGDDVEVPVGVPISTLRKAALVDSLGRPRAERVRMYRQYREAYRERYDQYPEPRTPARQRPILGRCPHCEQPEELECLPDCAMVDPLEAVVQTTPPHHAPRPWSKGWRR